MEISKEALEDFKRIYEKEFKETITDAEALDRAQRVLTLFSIIIKPLPEKYIESEKICLRVAEKIMANPPFNIKPKYTYKEYLEKMFRLFPVGIFLNPFSIPSQKF